MLLRIFRYSLFFTLLVLFSCKKEKYHTDSPTAYDMEILDAINAYRATKGLKAFEHSDVIWLQSNIHSENMANGVVPFGHDNLTERADKILAELGPGEVAENIGLGHGTAEEIVKSWLASVGHKEKIEGNYSLTGISAVQISNGDYYYTQLFYRKYPK